MMQLLFVFPFTEEVLELPFKYKEIRSPIEASLLSTMVVALIHICVMLCQILSCGIKGY